MGVSKDNRTKLNEKEFLTEVTSIIKNVLDDEELCTPISLETKLVNGVGTGMLDLSSIDYVDFISQIEETFDVIYDFDVMLYTVADVYSYINHEKTNFCVRKTEGFQDEQ